VTANARHPLPEAGISYIVRKGERENVEGPVVREEEIPSRSAKQQVDDESN
jgi:hypothetical protein